MNIFKNKKLRYGGLSVLFTVIFVVAVVLINIIVNLLFSRFEIKADLSGDKIFSIQSETYDYLSSIDDDITITLTYDEQSYISQGIYYNQVNEILKRFEEANPRINVRYLPLDENPSAYTKYGSGLVEGSIIIESGNTGRVRILTENEYIEMNYYINGQEVSYEQALLYSSENGAQGISWGTSASAEKALAASIMYVNVPDPTRVALFVGYGEAPTQTFFNLLTKNVFITETIDATFLNEIDPEIDYVIISAPLNDYSRETLDVLDKWLDNGGAYGKNLIYLASSKEIETPNLDLFLKQWGLEVGKSYLYQTNLDYAYVNNYYHSGEYMRLKLEDTEYVKDVNISSAITSGMELRPVNILFDENENCTTRAVLRTYNGAVEKPFSAGSDWTFANAEKTDAFPIIAESSKVTEASGEAVYSRVFVFGSELLIDDIMLQAPQSNNDQILLSILNNTTKKTELGITFTDKTFDVQLTEISITAKNTIAIIFAVIVPLIIIVSGVVVWLRRRRK